MKKMKLGIMIKFVTVIATVLLMASITVEADGVGNQHLFDEIGDSWVDNPEGVIFGNPANTNVMGTGFIDPFYRWQWQEEKPKDPNLSSGYNTGSQTMGQEAGLEEFNTKEAAGHNWTHSISVGDLSKVTVNGQEYYTFLLDINQNVSNGNPSNPGELLNIDQIKIFLTSDENITMYGEEGGDSSTGEFIDYKNDVARLSDFHTVGKVYDMDEQEENYITLDYSLFHGSGNGFDMAMWVPVAIFSDDNVAAYGDKIVLYTGSGSAPNDDNDGFQEWAHISAILQPPGSHAGNPVPEPTTVLLLGIGLAGMAGAEIRRRKRKGKNQTT